MEDDIEFEPRMSDADALMWNIEKDPLLRSTIVTIMVFDSALDRDRLHRRIDRVSRVIPRLRQRVRGHTLSIAPPRWDVDPNFDLDYHLRFMRAAGAGSLREVFDIAAPIAMQGFDRARPLWEFTLVEGLDDDRSALITKVHHAITDGVGGIRLMMEMLDVEQDAEDDLEARLPPAPEPVSANEPRRVLDALAYEGRRQIGNATRAISSITHEASRVRHDPVGAGIDVLSTAGSVARMVSPAGEPLSPLMVDRSLSVRFDTLQVPLGSMKKASKLVGGRLNDAFVGGVTGGLGRYHRRMGADVDKLRMTMPINVRSAATASVAGNQFAPARFPVPVAIDDPIARMNAVRELMEEQRREPALGLTDLMAGVLNRLPTTATTGIFGSMLRGVDFVTSNVPGPPIPVFLAGARLERQIAFGPMTGAAANITLLSYLDDLNIGVNTDPMAVTDPELLLECLADAFDEIIKLV
ncbi:MAG: wax ester/triacylglycerol synthase family O-acyltransferase [Acidimicrobiales bacterium]